ncbi:MAG TPA: CocE/NonD family hydrolase [Planctomycetota bacterium]
MILLLALLQDFTVAKDVAVPLKDGTKLATDVYLPKGDGPFPAIFVRTPYNKNGEKGNAEYFAKRGYAYVAQDTRGRYGSDGVWRFIVDDTADGAEAAAWLIAQPWSNGKFGMIGTSYVGGTQHAMALAKAPGLAAAIPVDAVSNMGIQSMRNAGAFELRFWNWTILNSVNGSQAARDPATKELLKDMADNRKHYLLNLPLRQGTTPLKLAPDYEAWLLDAMRHGANDAHWEANNIVDFPGRYKDIPVFLVGGWYDSWAGNTTANYRALSKTIKGPVHLIMGPWIHGRQGASAHGQVDFGKDAAIADPLAWRLAWYDRWLKGVDAPLQKSPVRVFVMGSGDCRKSAEGVDQHGGVWRDEQEWPLARAKLTPYYLGKGGTLGTGTSSGSTSFVFDPKNPVPTVGGCVSSNDGIMLQGAWDQRGGPHIWNSPEPLPLSARNDVLVFQTAPLAEDVEVTGELDVKLWISSTAPDTDFTAKLVDVHPRGFDMNVTDGILRCRFRDSLKEEKLMTPGQIYPVTIRLYPTSNVFKKGHRIRVDVSSSNFPRFDVNPNTGEPLNDHRRWSHAVNTVHHDPDRPSQILLPIVR